LYDRSPRKSLIDHFFDENVTAKDVQSGVAMERGDFFALPYDAKLTTSLWQDSDPVKA
jgi:4-alpha-glucanotransferase